MRLVVSTSGYVSNRTLSVLKKRGGQKRIQIYTLGNFNFTDKAINIPLIPSSAFPSVITCHMLDSRMLCCISTIVFAQGFTILRNL